MLEVVLNGAVDLGSVLLRLLRDVDLDLVLLRHLRRVGVLLGHLDNPGPADRAEQSLDLESGKLLRSRDLGQFQS